MFKLSNWLKYLKLNLLKQNNLSELKLVILIGTILTGCLLALKQIGLLQPLELAVFDQMVRLRPDKAPDNRILVVEISLKDTEVLVNKQVTDRVLANVLKKLQQYQPAVIGIDIVLEPYYPPGTEELKAEISKSNTIAIVSLGNNQKERTPPPQDIPLNRIAFNDIPVDPDIFVRRSTLIPFDSQFNYPSFSKLLVETYLTKNCPKLNQQIKIECQDIIFKKLENGDYKLGSKRFTNLPKDAGGYQKVDNRGHQFIIDYRSRKNPTLQVTLTEVIEGKVPPEWIKDKIILIGNTDPTRKDFFNTPFSQVSLGHRQMPGVILHAQITSQLLSVILDQQPLFWFWDEWLEIIWIIVWSILGGIIAIKIRNPLILIISGLSLILLLFTVGFLIFLAYGWIPIVTPALAFMLIGGTTIIYKKSEAQQQQEIVMSLLGQHTSPEIALALWEARDHLIESGRLPWQKLTATILFSDLKGFSTISEKQSPEVVMGWLNEYLTEMSDVIQQHQGVVNKFIGDGIMAVFGVPIAHNKQEEIAQDAQQAVDCALVMGQQLTELNAIWQQKGIETMKMRIGIFTGEVMVGSLGGKNRLEYGVIGDSVNTASRLESCEKERQEDNCRILIAEETLNYLNNRFQVEAWGHLTLKGKQQTVNVYRVLGTTVTRSK